MSQLQQSKRTHGTRRQPRRRRGFTLAELLVVIGIIALLVSILVPTVARIKTAAQATETRGVIRALDAAAEAYKVDYGKYPGLFPESMLGIGNTTMNVDVEHAGGTALDTLGFWDGGGELENVTSSENFFLSLQGGILRSGNRLIYDPTRVGQGPANVGLANISSKPAYTDLETEDATMHVSSEYDAANSVGSPDGLRHGRYVDRGVAAAHSIVPEFIDSFSQGMPILYLRPVDAGRNAYAAEDSGPNRIGRGVYQLQGIEGYVANLGSATDPRFVGEGRETLHAAHETNTLYHGLQEANQPSDPGDLPDASDDFNELNGFNTFEGTRNIAGTPIEANDGPFDGNLYFTDPNAGRGARQANRFILISAGVDRIYGTADDITNFGPVRP